MRKIDTINQLKDLGLRVAEAREFRAQEMTEMLSWANHLINKYGTFNVRTDLPEGNRAGTNLPFLMNCSISKLMQLVNERGDSITYIVHEHIDLDKQLFNATLRLCDDKVIGELNDIDKVSQRAGLLNASNLKQVCNPGDNPVFKKIKEDLMQADQDAWFELTALKNGGIIYWQIVPEKMTSTLKKLFIQPM